MQSVKTGLLWLLCAVDAALGLWLAQVFIKAAHGSSARQIVAPENIGYILYVALLFIAPILCYLLRTRASFAIRLLIAALPIALFLALGGKFSVRWV